jgi:hypothetical protein
MFRRPPIPFVSFMLVLCIPMVLMASTAGPDADGWVLIDSSEENGPPHVWTDATFGSSVDPGPLLLPFDFVWYGEVQTFLTVGTDGTALFDGEATACPGEGDWSGFQMGAGGESVWSRTLGRYPNRGFLIDWGYTQLTLLERRNEAVMRIDTVPDTAIVGTQGGSGDGLAWACDDASSISGRTAWVSEETQRSLASLRSTSDLSQSWWGSRPAEFFGERIATGDVNGDGLSDILVGEPEGDVAFLFYGKRTGEGSGSSLAAMTITGDDGGRLGAALLLTDLDNDGLDDVVIGEPRAVGGGQVHIFLAAGGLAGSVSAAEADARIEAPLDGGSGSFGAALATGDTDGDVHLDLVVGAPDARVDGVNVGAVWVLFGDGLWDADRMVELDDAWIGSDAGDQAGLALGVGDLDGDDLDELIVGVPYGNASGEDAGRVHVLDAVSPAGRLSERSRFTVRGASGGDLFGTSVDAGDLDGLGRLDLVVGAVGERSLGPRTGAVYVFLDALEHGLVVDADDADHVISGPAAASSTGSSVVIGELDGDPESELVVGATGGDPSFGGAGMVAIFRELPAESSSLNDSDHRLYGLDSGAELGTDVVIATDLQGDGYPDLIVASPLETPGDLVGAGAVWVWPFIPDYVDDDADGFVAHSSGGLDCDDTNDSVHPNQVEIDGNLVDDDCDGWVDGLFIARITEAGWTYDLNDVLRTDDSLAFDFEDGVSGESVTSLYAAEGMELFSEGVVRASRSIWGAAPVGTLGAQITAGTGANDLIFNFGAPVDAVSMRILDGEVGFRMDAVREGSLVVDAYLFEAHGPDTPGGVFQGFTFAEPVDQFRIAAESPNGWGVDNVAVVFTAGSDRDGDGLSAEDGDCDDFDASVGPGATELYGDGVDNDCDGVVDAGAAGLYLSEGAFVADVSIIGARVDFEEPDLGAAIVDQYGHLGISFAGELIVDSAVDASGPRDAQAGRTSSSELILNFDERQPALALWLLDANGQVSVTASRDDIVLYDVDLAPGTTGFVGFSFPVPADTVRLVHDESGDIWGIDDVTFSALGLDDADGDGFTEADGDCDDTEPDAYPGAEEVWYDGIDGDCDGGDDYDADGDGHSTTSGVAFDCDDLDDSTYPGAEDDWYDGVDADCAGDDDFDSDGDGHRSALFGGDDCDDEAGEVHPDAEEVFYDDVDDDCDPTTDHDADGDGWASGGFPGAIGVYGVGDCDDETDSTHPEAEETWYDGIDSDCGGDDDYDADGDGHIPVAYGGDDCDDADGESSPESIEDVCYDGIDSDCDGHSDFDCDRDGHDDVAYGGDDCDDTDGSHYPGDGVTPEGPDLDCDGYVSTSAGGDDCDDGHPGVHPGAVDSWYDGTDSDCGGEDDYDRDGDGHRAGAWAEDSTLADCDDGDDSVHPSVSSDDCGGGDEDCDGELDEDCRPSDDTGGGSSSDEDSDFDIDSDADIDADSDADVGADSDADFDGGSDTGVGGGESDDSGDASGIEEDTGGSEVEVGADSGGAADEPEDPNAGWEAPAPGSVSTSGSSEKREGCGCNLAPRPPSWLWMGSLLSLLGWRRRSPKGNA